MFNEPFRGITTAGERHPDLFAPRPEGAPTLAMIEAVNALLAVMSPEQKKARASRPVEHVAALAEHRTLSSSTTACGSTRSASRYATR